MPFSAQELENILNAQLDYHIAGQPQSQTLQNKPLMREMNKRSKGFASSKEFITKRVKGDYTSTLEGYQHNDVVGYSNPANIKVAQYPHKRLHIGSEVTFQELNDNGITIEESLDGTGETRHSGREQHALTDLLTDKLEDMQESNDRGYNLMLWRDGSEDSDFFPGITSFVLDDPTSATIVAGIDQSSVTWWRNRAVLNTDASTPSNQNLITVMQREFRQLRRYGNPTHKIFAGSDFIEALEQEVRSAGTLTDSGFMKAGQTDAGMADIQFKGNPIMYDPTLDDEGKEKYCYVLDVRQMYPMHMLGERWKKHNPARPHNQYLLYRAMTYVGGIVCWQRNTSGVYTIS